MPNHCHNDLYVSGAADRVQQLIDLVGIDRGVFDFHAVIPEPAIYQVRDAEHIRAFGRDYQLKDDAAQQAFIAKWGDDKNGFNSGGFEWRTQHWGTKWGAYEVLRRDYGGLCVTFQTAWGPSLPVTAALAIAFPDLLISHEYFERGYQIAGGVTFEPGEPVIQWQMTGYCGTRGG